MAEPQNTVTITVAIDQAAVDGARQKKKEFLKGHPFLDGTEPAVDSGEVVRFAINQAASQQFGEGWKAEYPVMDDPWSSFWDIAILIPPGRHSGWDRGSRIQAPPELQNACQSRKLYKPGEELVETISIQLQAPQSPNSW